MRSFETLWDESALTRLNGSQPFEAGLKRVREQVHEALTSLPPESRSVVLLHYFSGYDYGETAALLDVPVSTVRGRLHLARRRLREEMAELAPAKRKTEAQRAPIREGALTAADLAALRGAEMLASRDPTRPVLQTVCIEPDGTLVSTDTHHLYLYRGSSLKPSSQAVISSSPFARLKHRRELTEAHLSITAEEATLRYVDERDTPSEHVDRAPLVTHPSYPRYERIIPADWRITASLSVRDLLAALDEVARFEVFLHSSAMPGSPHEDQRITLTFSGSDGVVIVQDGAIKSEPAPAQWLFRTEIPVILHGQAVQEEFTLALNRAYLRECLSALNIGQSERVEMCFNSPEDPMLLNPDGEANRFTLIMPMHRHR